MRISQFGIAELPEDDPELLGAPELGPPELPPELMPDDMPELPPDDPPEDAEDALEEMSEEALEEAELSLMPLESLALPRSLRLLLLLLEALLLIGRSGSSVRSLRTRRGCAARTASLQSLCGCR